MSISTEIARLQTAKSDLKTSIEAKGVSVLSDAKLDTYSDYVDSIHIPTVQTNKTYTVSSAGTSTINPDSGYEAMNSVGLTVPTGSYSASVTNSAGSASMSVTGFTAASSGNYYVTLSTNSGSATGTATIGTAGYIAAGSKTSTATVDVTGNGNKIYIPEADPTANVEVTNPSVAISKTPTGFTPAESSDYYVEVEATPTSGRAAATAGVTQLGIVGANETASDTKDISVSTSGVGKVYIPAVDIPNPTMGFDSTTHKVSADGSWTAGYTKDTSYTGSYEVTLENAKAVTGTTSLSAGSGSLTLTPGEGTVNTSGNISLTQTASKPSSGYYITSTGSGTVSGVGKGTVSVGTGYITSGSQTSNEESGSSSSNTATKYYTIPTGTSTVSGSISQSTPSISVDSSGLITASVTATSGSITPSTTAGYISASGGTAGTINLTASSNTSQLSTQAATTITPKITSQVGVSSGKYTTGDITVGALYTEVSTSAGMDAINIDANKGKMYKYTGTTDSTYTNGRLYIVTTTGHTLTARKTSSDTSGTFYFSIDNGVTYNVMDTSTSVATIITEDATQVKFKYVATADSWYYFSSTSGDTFGWRDSCYAGATGYTSNYTITQDTSFDFSCLAD